MNKFSVFCALVLMFFTDSMAQSPPNAVPVLRDQGAAARFYRQFIRAKLEVGFEGTFWTLNETSRRRFDASGNYLGGFAPGLGADTLSLQGNPSLAPMLRYRPISFLAIDLNYESLDASVRGSRTGIRYGDLALSGPSVSLMLVYENDTIFMPYAGAGFAWLSGDFSVDASWSGGPGYTRVMQASNAQPLLLSLGCSVQLREQLELDVRLRQLTGADIDGLYALRWDDGRSSGKTDFTWPMSARAVQIALRYVF